MHGTIPLSLPSLAWSSPASVLGGAVRALADSPRSLQDGPPLSLTLMLAFTGCTLALVVGMLVVGFVLSMGRDKRDKDGGKKK